MSKETTIDLLAEKIVVDKFEINAAFIHIQDARQICKKSVLAALEGMEQRMIGKACKAFCESACTRSCNRTKIDKECCNVLAHFKGIMKGE